MTNQEKFEEVFGQKIDMGSGYAVNDDIFVIITPVDEKYGWEQCEEWLNREYKNPAERKATKNVKEAIENMIKELEKSLAMLEGIN